MKFFKVKTIQIIWIHFLLIGYTHANMIDPEDYIVNLSRRMIENLESTEISGKGLPMKDFSNQIDATLYSLLVKGSINFHSGFINKILSANLRTNNIKSAVQEKEASIIAEFNFNGVEVFYDMDVDVTGYKGKGNILIVYDKITFMIEIRKSLVTNVLTIFTIDFASAGQLNMRLKFYPNNGHIQLIAKEIQSKSVFREPLTQSFREWKDNLQEHLATAANDFEFPVICYYCPTYKSRKDNSKKC